MIIGYSSLVKTMICALVIDHSKDSSEPLFVSDIMSTFTHPEVCDLRIEAYVWFNANECRPDDIVVPVTNRVNILLATLRGKSDVGPPKILT